MSCIHPTAHTKSQISKSLSQATSFKSTQPKLKVVSCVYILDLKGKVLISRNYRGDIPLSAVDNFMPLILASEEEDITPPPVLSADGIHYLYIKFNNIYGMWGGVRCLF